ncbi:alkaline-phosphatase-like protein [Pterulicium gracile]|uniref:Alkaline-phosphatase-like protein n=1 Tax=Pterulicium gracile TaxID=1884261 RepID=A0A5C3QQP6_9AGAR|nr:alkaline-phosphatase-like protein [Pterula gracilis]
MSNGTHEFKKTVLIVSIDGLRADYLDRGLTPHLLDISRKGLRAKSMQPIFPTLTFPNHWSLMTGLFAESHGIVGNNFWDPRSKREFHYNQISSCWQPEWWLGEPMWETSERSGIVTANLMWPGPPKTMSGASSTYFIPWRDHVSLEEKLDNILSWVDMPLEKRPQLIMAYEPSLDQAGHKHGPMSGPVNETLAKVDIFANDLHTSLVARNLSDIVDIVFVSDHGMTDTSHPENIYIDDIIGKEGLDAIDHEDGWPAMGLRFKPTANAGHYLSLFLNASSSNPDKFDVYTHDTMPQRYHFVKNERIAPIYVVPRMGYVLTTREKGNVGMTKGNHGYDNKDPSMQAMFVAHGPFAAVTKALHSQKIASASSSSTGELAVKNKGWHSVADDVFVMDPFANVEIYNLVVKLLGVPEGKVAGTNGTEGFWDTYL